MFSSSAMSVKLKIIGISIRENAIEAVYKTATIEAFASLARRLLALRDTATKHPPTTRYVNAKLKVLAVKSASAEPSS